MGKLKVLFVFGFIAIIIYVVYSFFTSGQPWTLDSFTTYILNGSSNTIQSITTFVTDKWQMVTASIGAVATVFFGLYRTIAGKFNQMKTTATSAQNQVEGLQIQMTDQYNTMQRTIGTQEDKIGMLEQKLSNYQQLEDTLTGKEETYKTLEQNYQTLQTQFNTLQTHTDPDYVRLLEETLDANSIPKPTLATQTITVVK